MGDGIASELGQLKRQEGELAGRWSRGGRGGLEPALHGAEVLGHLSTCLGHII